MHNAIAKPDPIRAVVFDVFGTLAVIREKRRPFASLLRRARRQGLLNREAFDPMACDVGLADTARLLGLALPGDELARLEKDLLAELASVVLFDDVLPTLSALRAAGYKIALCSNLAAPYARPVMQLLPFELDAYAWSYEVGAIKPDRLIYAQVCERLQCAPAEVLMIGDTVVADYHGPVASGMQALHLARAGSSKVGASIASLTDLLPLLPGCPVR